MLFAVSYTTRANVTEESLGRSLKLFAKWEPPPGFIFKAHYSTADGNGGLALVETDSAAAVLEVCSAWTSFFEFKTSPLVELEEAMQIRANILQWRDSVK